MKLVTFINPDKVWRSGWLVDNGVVDMQKADPRLPSTMLEFIDNHEELLPIAKAVKIETPHYKLEEVELKAPLPEPRSFRDYIGFETHMLNASKSFGHKLSEVWYEMPIFYFTNHHGITGPNDEIKRPKKEHRMDLELEMGCIIGKAGKDIPASEGKAHIFGYTIFNDWTARATQAKEMNMPLGPHKGKDFANTIGPCIVTYDEMEQYATEDERFDISMKAYINDQEICSGNYKTIHYTFGQMIERASENGVELRPGDILGSGTVGWGSLIENNFSVHRPLEPGDSVKLEIEGIGELINKVV